MSETVLKLAEERVIADCVEHMGRVQRQIWWLHEYAEGEVARKEGFRGVFAILQPALDDLAVATGTVAGRFSEHYGEVIGALEQSARALRVCDEVVDVELARLTKSLGVER
jgi:hypothetical protein